VRRVRQKHLADVFHIGTEWEQLTRAVRLVPHRFPRRQFDRTGVVEAADASHRAEVVVERAVLLHEKDDVLDVVNRAGSVVGRDGESGGEIRGKRGGSLD
jgi:hypothetical protein